MYRIYDNARLGGAARLNKVDSLWLLFTSLHNYLHGSLNIMHARLAFCRENQGKVDVFITKLTRNDRNFFIYSISVHLSGVIYLYTFKQCFFYKQPANI